MKANHEKTTRMMGFVVSFLLHGIFLAGCVAIDYGSLDSSAESTEMNQPIEQAEMDETKS